MPKLTIRISLVLASCLVGILLAEGALRLTGVWVGRHSDTMFTVIEYDPVLGWKMKPNVQERVSLVDVENIPVRANSQGFWDNEFKLEKDPQRRRIAFLGDSFTWGMGVRENERFSNVLQQSVSQFESLNFGVPGYGTDQSLLVWENVASRYRPDVVVLTIYQNDYVDNMFVVRSGLRKPYFEWHEGSAPELRGMDGNTANFWTDGVFNQAAPPYITLFPRPTEKRSRVLHWLVKHSDLARLAYTILRRVNDGDQPSVTQVSAQAKQPQPAGITTLSDLPPTERREVELMSALIKQLATEVKGSGAKFIVVLAGSPIMNFNVQEHELDRADIRYIDATTGALAANLPQGERQLYFPYNKHWTAAGHRAVAGLIEQTLRDEDFTTGP